MSPVVVIIDILLILIAIGLIIVVLMQEGQTEGLGAIGGGAETFFGKNKAKSIEGKLATITKIAAVVFIVLAIATTILVSHQTENAANDSVIIEDAVEETENTEEAGEGEEGVAETEAAPAE